MASLSFGLSHLNTVERLKMRSGSSAARAGASARKRDKLSTSQPDNYENVKQVEADGRDHEQIDGCDVRRMVTQKRAPALPEWVASFGHVLGDGRLSDRKAELQQLTVNAWRTPKQVLNAHPPDQRTQLCIDLRPTSKRSRFPATVAAKGSTMPAHEGLGPNDCHGLEN